MNILNFLGFGRNRRMSAADLLSPEAKAAAAWIETVNPLRGMTATRMQALYDASRNGDTVHLQWLYQEIERVDPTLLTCSARRRGALASLDWHVSTRAEKRARGFDRKLAEEQADCLELAFGGADAENMNDAVEHLSGAFFRGFAHVLPLWSADGLSLRGFETLDQWNFVRDISTGTWYWNPEANAYTDYSSCRPIPDGEVFVFSCPYHIDYPALAIYLRSAVGEKGWARFVERFGIPPVILTMPNDIPKDQVDMWRAQAERVAEGGSGAVPGGTGVNFCDGARGINPFKDFVHNQRELIVLMATGGLLTSLAESGSGTLAGGAHADTWAEIRRGDAAKLGSSINRALAGAILDRAFPGRPHLAYFAFDAEAVPSPGEVFEDAAKARSAGYLIAREDLEERTGYRLEKIETPPAPGEGTAPAPHLFNKETSAPPLKTPSKPLKTASGNPDGQGEGAGDLALLEAFSRDTGPAADAVKRLLADPTPEKAKRLLGELNSLIPEDPALAAVIADAMAAEFASTTSQPSQKSQPSQDTPLANKDGEKCKDCGQWIDGNGVCHECRGRDDLASNGYNPDDEKMQSAEIGKGKAAVRKCLDEGVDCYDAIARSDIGSISLIYGQPVDDGSGKAFGLSHLFHKHKGEGIVENLAESLIRGKVREPGKSGNKIAIDYKGYQIHLAKSFSRKGNPNTDKVTWVITGFKTDKEDA